MKETYDSFVFLHGNSTEVFLGTCICSWQRQDKQSKGQIAKSRKYRLMLKTHLSASAW